MTTVANFVLFARPRPVTERAPSSYAAVEAHVSDHAAFDPNVDEQRVPETLDLVSKLASLGREPRRVSVTLRSESHI